MHVVELVTRTLTSTRCQYCLTEGPVVCGDCVLSIGITPKSSCVVCNTITIDHKICSRCRKISNLNTVAAVFRYEADVEKLLNSYKFQGNRSLSKSIATAMHSEVKPFKYDILVGVPSSPARIRSRGFDHSMLITKNVSKLLNVAINKPIVRLGAGRQVGSSRRDRFEQVTSQYSLKSNASKIVAGKNVLLLDDVVTTGATLSRCALLLHQAGAKRIDAIVFARR